MERRQTKMDVANSSHLRHRTESSHASDVTPEAVQEMRDRARPKLEGKTFTCISSTDPSNVGAKVSF